MRAGIFDLDGVITNTAKIHFAAWKQTFDEFLQSYSQQQQKPQRPFIEEDYILYVDGKPRIGGIRSFFKSRNISIPLGSSQDDPEAMTLHGVAKKKQAIFIELVNMKGVPLFDSTIRFIHQLIDNDVKTAIVSSSKNCEMILNKAGIEDLFLARLDGMSLDKLGLAGKPQPDLFLEAGRRIDVKPQDAFIVEDALSGVRAGKAGGFGLVIAIDRSGDMEKSFLDNGADIVINDMGDMTMSDVAKMM